jgi:hypothetical protein
MRVICHRMIGTQAAPMRPGGIIAPAATNAYNDAV